MGLGFKLTQVILMFEVSKWINFTMQQYLNWKQQSANWRLKPIAPYNG